MSQQAIVLALRGWRFHFQNELELQDGIGQVLDRVGMPYQREVALSKADRIDFLVGDCGIEVKVDGSTAAVLRQLHRYSQQERIASLVLVTNRARHHDLPSALSGKPVELVELWRRF